MKKLEIVYVHQHLWQLKLNNKLITIGEFKEVQQDYKQMGGNIENPITYIK